MDLPSEKKNVLLRSLVWFPPLLLLPVLVVFRGGNVPWGDDVSMCPIFDKFYRSTLTFGDLWAPYQGHRILCHRLLELALGWATRWNLNIIIGCIYLMLVGNFLLLRALVRDLRPVLPEEVRLGLMIVCSLAVFSTTQVAIWNNGFNLGPALSVTSVLGGVWVLTRFGGRYLALGFCLVAGVVASFSFGNGLTYWVALTPLLWVQLRADPQRGVKTSLWILTAGLVVAAYFHGLGGNGTNVSFGQALINVLRMPGAFLAYWWTCAGAGVFFLNGAQAALPAPVRLLVACGAPLCGLLGLAGSGWAVWKLWERRWPHLPLLAPWLSLGLYAVGSVGLVALTRFSSFPLMSAIASHYVIFSQFMWLALAVGLAVLAPVVRRGWRVGLGTGLVLCYLVSYANGLRYARSSSLDLRQARAELLTQPTTRTYHAINPDRDPAQVASFLEMTRQHRLALYRDVTTP